MSQQSQTLRPPAGNRPQTPRPLLGGLGSRTSPKEKAAPRPLITTKPRKLIALDTETTGLDIFHGCKPFYISTLDEDGILRSWEWDVDPMTREVQVPKKDLAEVAELIEGNDFVLHNTKFDLRALASHRLPLPRWSLNDTLIASHVLVSNDSHKLKDLAIQYLDIYDDDEKALQESVNAARRIGRQLGWRIAQEGDPHFPAFKPKKGDGWWKCDLWLPRAVAKHKWEVEGDPDYAPPPARLVSRGEFAGHPWWTVLATYANRDVERTLGLWLVFKDALEKENSWSFYEERRQNLEALYTMENHGVTLSSNRLNKRRQEQDDIATKAKAACLKIAKNKIDNLGSPKQLEGFLYSKDGLGLRPTKRTKCGYSTDKEVMLSFYDHLSMDNTKHGKRAFDFVRNLMLYRKNTKANDYLDEYETRSFPAEDLPEWLERLGIPLNAQIRLLNGNFNPTGTDTTRLSASGPNLQNIGKQIDPRFGDQNIRRCFGPAPGREWYSIDYSNIEMRIFAYESGDEKLIESFTQGFSVHCIFSEILFPKEYKACKVEAAKKLGSKATEYAVRKETESIFKTKYESTLYQWTKNGNFALIYGAGIDKADTTYHRPGGYHAIRKYLPLVDEFLSAKDEEARTFGFIRTLGNGKCKVTGRPQGYRLYVPPSEPHVAVNYFVQGSAGWCMNLAINRVHRYLNELNSSLFHGPPYKADRSPYKAIMTIHDEIVYDFPQDPRNLNVITKVAKLMEKSGEDIELPTPVEVERHTENWAVGEKVKI